MRKYGIVVWMQSRVITDTIVLAYNLKITFVAHWGKSLSMHLKLHKKIKTLYCDLATGNPGSLFV